MRARFISPKTVQGGRMGLLENLRPAVCAMVITRLSRYPAATGDESDATEISAQIRCSSSGSVKVLSVSAEKSADFTGKISANSSLNSENRSPKAAQRKLPESS